MSEGWVHVVADDALWSEVGRRCCAGAKRSTVEELMQNRLSACESVLDEDLDSVTNGLGRRIASDKRD